MALELSGQRKRKNGPMEENHDYEAGLRDGKITSLESTVDKLTKDVSMLNKAVYLLYGAIALVQFILPLMESDGGVFK